MCSSDLKEGKVKNNSFKVEVTQDSRVKGGLDYHLTVEQEGKPSVRLSGLSSHALASLLGSQQLRVEVLHLPSNLSSIGSREGLS